MPASFQIIGAEADMWVPMAFPPGSVMDSRRNRFSNVLGRLKPEASLVQAQEDVAAVSTRLAAAYPAFNAGRGAAVGFWRDGIGGGVRTTWNLLFGAVIFVLLITCPNPANLLTARWTTRLADWRD